ncbi:hypothetical protein J3R83DRAFT_1206 [Lanmaoa asiatica]|nr:hypothetical protein J3R83DRAFT_1206 [Lanmaoa asiatica]
MGYGPPPSKPGKWSLSTKKKNRNGKDGENYNDFMFPKFPVQATTATYGIPYYPQMQSAFPAYLAPVQMAVVQPIGVQQPVLAMPQAYAPMATYQTTAAPVQPAFAPAPAIQPAPAMQMPPRPSSRCHPPHHPPPRHGCPNPIPSMNHLHSKAQSSRPRRVSPPGPVIPPPSIVASEPPRAAPDSARLRFTDFYRPAGLSPSRRLSVDELVRPPTTGPPGRTPFIAPMSMPMPMPTSNNPLPAPPADVWDSSPYRQVLENLPNDLPAMLDLQHYPDSLVGMPEPISRPSSRLAGLFGSTSRRDKGKNPLRGLFRSRSISGHDVQSDTGSRSGSQHGHGRAQTMTSVFISAPSTITSTMDMPQPSVPTTSMPVPTHGPPIKFDHTGDYAGFVNHSNHRVMYKNKMYPTALHLLEAMKFTHQPALQERIRTCKDVNDMYPLSASLQEHVRSDWGQVFLQTMEEVLYLKFKQHPSLRTLLRPSGEGSNELGKALVRVRERLRQEGEI